MPSSDFDLFTDAASGTHALFDSFFLRHGENLLDAGESDDRVARHGDDLLAGFDDDVGFGERTGAQRALGHWALRLRSSTFGCSQRWPARAARPGLGICSVSPSTVSSTVWPMRTSSGFALGYRQAQAQRIDAHQGHDGRAGRQILADGGLAFADGAVDRRNDDGIGELLARDLELGTALHQHRLAVAHLFDGILIAPFGHRELRDRRVELGARDEFSLPQLHHPVMGELGFLEHRRRLTHRRRLFDVDFVAVSRRRRPRRTRACWSAASA